MSSSPTPMPDQLDDFKLLHRLGEGGMGVVYAAEQLSLPRRAALKILRPEQHLFADARSRLQVETDALCRLQHPSIVPLIASGETSGMLWLATQWIPGASADAVLRALQGRDPSALTGRDLLQLLGGSTVAGEEAEPFRHSWWEACVHLILSTALGLSHAHQRGVLHCDLKPANVMLCPDGHAVVLDFGVAMVVGNGSSSGSTAGTPAWMSPEQLRREPVDERTDVYSLAATLHALLTLQLPQDGSAVRFLPLRRRNRQAPRDLAVLLAAALDPDRSCRPASMAVFADDLRAVLQHAPLQTRRTSPRRALSRWLARHRSVAALFAAALLALLLLPTALWWQGALLQRRLRQDQQRSQAAFAIAADTVNEVHLRASMELADEFGCTPVSIAMLREALAWNRELLARNPDDPLVQHRLLACLAKLAKDLADDGQEHEAAALAEESLQRPRPSIPKLAAGLHELIAESHQTLGELAAKRLDTKAALPQLQLGIDTCAAALGALDRDDPAFAKKALLLAQREVQGHTLRISLALRVADRAAAAAFLDTAAERVAAVEALLGPSPWTQSMQVHLHRHRGRLLQERSDFAGARTEFEAALALNAQFPDSFDTWPTRRLQHGVLLASLAELDLHEGDLATAENRLRQALPMIEGETRKAGREADSWIQFGTALHALGETLRHARRFDEALACAQRAIAVQQAVLQTSPGYALAEDCLVRHQMLACNCTLALQRWPQLVELARAAGGHAGAPRVPGSAALFALDAARHLDQDGDAAAAEAARVLAIGLLHECVRRGGAREIPWQLPLFTPLQGRPDFAELQHAAGK